MAKPTYWELLKHPLWQKKRLAIFERAGFECEDCGDKEKTLHVHHTYYEKGHAPWEYPDESLHCLCEDCHKKAQDLLQLLHRQIGKAGSDVERLYGYALGLEAESYPMVVLDVLSYSVAQGIADVFGVLPEEVIEALEERVIDGYKLDTIAKAKRRRGRD